MTHLEMAEKLDAMDQSVTSWEAEFLDSVLKALRAGSTLSAKQIDVLCSMYNKYIDGGYEGADLDEP